MRKMKKLAAIALIAGIGTAVLTGCSDDSTANNPTKSDDGGYSESYVKLDDGRTVMCLYHNGNASSTSTMSCDFDHPIKK
jgi:hypothetical protein